MTALEIHETLAQQGIRLFALSLGSDNMFFAHGGKTVNDWRNLPERNLAVELVDAGYGAAPRTRTDRTLAFGYIEPKVDKATR